MVHAIGDRAQDVVLDGFEKHWGPKSEYEKTGGWRLRLEHVTVSREDEYPRMKEMGVYPSFMSSFYYWLGEYCYKLVSHAAFLFGWLLTVLSFHSAYSEAFGPTLRERMVTFRSAQSHDLIWNVHSDTPVVPIQPVRDWQVMVDRKTHSGKIYSPEQTVSRQEALRALTINGAIALGVDQVTGSLEVGKYADFAVLAEDPWEIETDKLGSIAVDETWLVGRRRVWTD